MCYIDVGKCFHLFNCLYLVVGSTCRKSATNMEVKMRIQDLTQEQYRETSTIQDLPRERFSRGDVGAHQQTSLHEVLRHLVTILTLPQPLDEVLHSLTRLTAQALPVDLCLILLYDQARDYLRVCAWSPDLATQQIIMHPITVDQALWDRLRTCMLRNQLPLAPWLSFQELESLNPLKNVEFETLLPLPLQVGNECIGLINCYTSRVYEPCPEDQLMLTTIASQVALAIKNRNCINEGTVAQKTLVKAFVNDLCAGNCNEEEALCRRAHFLGYDLAQPHAVVLFELSEVEEMESIKSKEERLLYYEASVEQIRRHIDRQHPGSLIDERENLLTCLISIDRQSPANVDQLTSFVDEIMQDVRREQHVCMSAGIGNLCRAVGDYQRGYNEAYEALKVGQPLNQRGSSMHFNALGAYRYIYKFALADTLHDQYQDQVGMIADYDRRKKANLLDTLEIYLECGGNVAKTSSQLNVHRNTLLQRLTRLQRLCALDLEHLANRLPLLVALKVHRLRTNNA